MKNRSETFGRLLKAGIGSIVICEGKKAPVVEDELGQQIGVSADAIQRYKAGALPPEPRTVQILADACVRRGFMNRDWLQSFLHAARYHQADKLLDHLCPIGPARPRPPRVYENLPAPTYSQFVNRPQAFAEVADGLGKRTAAVLIVGLGGNGKTSLAREVSAHCLRDTDETPRFDSVVWVSDKDRPGTTNLSTVLDEIARTLDYPGFTQFEHDEKRREVEQLLKRQRVLVVVDNFETITDGALLTWLINMPEPSKALITSREYRREWRSSWPVELRGMSESEAWDLISERARVLKIDRLIGERVQLEPLLVATGGNPKALTMTLGLLKYERRPLQQVVDDLYAARGDLFDDLFTRAWALLDEAARRVLLAMPLFASSACGAAMAVIANVNSYTFANAVERLADLALIDVRLPIGLNAEVRYVLHPLVRAFTTAKLCAEPHSEAEMRERWLQWYTQLTVQVGYCWNDLSRLDMLDPEQETIHAVIEWTVRQKRFSEVLKIVKGVRYYYYVRGMWEQNPPINLIGVEAARTLAESIEEAEAIAYHIQILCKQGKPDVAERFILRLREITQTTQVPESVFFELQHAIALFAIAQQDIDQAEVVWQQTLEMAEKLDIRAYIANRRWLATCLYRKRLISDAEQLLCEALRDAIQHKYVRGVVSIQTKLANIYLDRNDTDRAAAALADGQNYASQYSESRHVAELQQCIARLHTLRGDLPAARASLADAIDLFERLGMRRELAEARAALARLDASDTPLIGASEA